MDSQHDLLLHPGCWCPAFLLEPFQCIFPVNTEKVSLFLGQVQTGIVEETLLVAGHILNTLERTRIRPFTHLVWFIPFDEALPFSVFLSPVQLWSAWNLVILWPRYHRGHGERPCTVLHWIYTYKRPDSATREGNFNQKFGCILVPDFQLGKKLPSEVILL